ncbi:MAG: protease Do [Planctomycetaceae bacterium]|nr:protease Do [Planctomycetaceae bacterium]
MKTERSRRLWILTTVSLASLMTGAAFFSQNLLIGRQPTLPTDVKISHAKELSSAFREVAQSALPAIVSIETTGKAGARRVADVGDSEDGPGADNPLNDVFKNNPELRELFKRRGGSNGAPQSAPRSHGMGSGFIIDASGVIVTNNHVVAGADQVVVHLRDGSEYKAYEWKTDPRSDVAIVRIKPAAPLPTLKLGDSDASQVGDWVLAVGSPFGLDFTVTAGIISAKGRGQGILEREDFLQTDAAINPGNSGGPLLNLDGEVVGINTAISSRSGGYDGVGFAIPSNMARWVSKQLTEHGEVRRVFLGVLIQPVSNDLARQFNIKVGQGAIVGEVVPDSPAAAAKLESGDVILTLNGKPVSNPRNLQGIVEQLEAGKSYPLEILRNGKQQSINVTIREMPKSLSLASAKGQGPHEPEAETKASPFKDLGVEVQDVQQDLTDKLGYKGLPTGVLLSEVTADSPAEHAGLKAGMVIEKVGQKRVTNVKEFSEAMKELSIDKGVLFLVRTPTGSRCVVVSKAS